MRCASSSASLSPRIVDVTLIVRQLLRAGREIGGPVAQLRFGEERIGRFGAVRRLVVKLLAERGGEACIREQIGADRLAQRDDG